MTEIIKEFISRFTDSDVLQDTKINVQNGIYSYIPNQITEFISSAKEAPTSIGLPLGRYRDGVFKATPHLLERIVPHTSQKIQLNAKATWLFVCGRDVFKENVITDKGRTQELRIVLDENKEVIGLTKPASQKGKTFYKNITDVGERLRREQTHQKR